MQLAVYTVGVNLSGSTQIIWNASEGLISSISHMLMRKRTIHAYDNN